VFLVARGEWKEQVFLVARGEWKEQGRKKVFFWLTNAKARNRTAEMHGETGEALSSDDNCSDHRTSKLALEPAEPTSKVPKPLWKVLSTAMVETLESANIIPERRREPVVNGLMTWRDRLYGMSEEELQEFAECYSQRRIDLNPGSKKVTRTSQALSRNKSSVREDLVTNQIFLGNLLSPQSQIIIHWKIFATFLLLYAGVVTPYRISFLKEGAPQVFQ
ncbi:hypothetical protein CYMTET_33783, partial [Cymbomonas tetramitiformis]